MNFSLARASQSAPVLAIFTAGLLFFPMAGVGQSAAAPAGGDTTSRIDALLQTLNAVRAPVTAAISPDGDTVAWTVDGPHGSELHLTGVALAAAADRTIAPDTLSGGAVPEICNASHPAWSPDGRRLAFLSDCTQNAAGWLRTGQNNVFVWTVGASGVQQVSHLQGPVSAMQWSPDGRVIAFLYVEGATRRAGALDAMKPWSGVYGEDGVEVQRVYAVNPADGQGDFVTGPSLHVYEFCFNPAGQAASEQIAFVAANPPGEDNWWTARLYTQRMEMRSCRAGDVACQTAQPSDTRTKLVFDPAATAGSLHGLQIAVPRFSPDGQQIAFIGGLMSDQGSTGGDIYLVPADGLKQGTAPQDVTPGRDASPAWIVWLGDDVLGISEHVGGSSHLVVANLQRGADGAMTAVDDPNLSLTLADTVIAGTDAMSVSTSRTENIALIRQSYEQPPEVWAGPLDHLRPISHLNDALKPAWGKSESVEYTNEGFHIQGWLIYPANYDPAKRYPLIVSVHGGPSNAVTPRWPTASYGAVPMSALGYFVFLPNPRGSFGEGEKFTQANIKDFGYGDLRDVLAGVDILEKRFPIDKNREGITGWSYGGFMTMFAVTQTTRFRAAVAGAGLANWQSYYGENSIDQWMIPFFGASVYDDPAVYAKSSPINFIRNVKTPTLVVVGDRDGECPAPQSFEFWHALRDLGVKTQLVIYPNEGHHFVDPAHQRDVLKRALAWFATEMPPE